MTIMSKRTEKLKSLSNKVIYSTFREIYDVGDIGLPHIFTDKIKSDKLFVSIEDNITMLSETEQTNLIRKSKLRKYNVGQYQYFRIRLPIEARQRLNTKKVALLLTDDNVLYIIPKTEYEEIFDE